MESRPGADCPTEEAYIMFRLLRYPQPSHRNFIATKECCDVCLPLDPASIEFANCNGNCVSYACFSEVSQCEEFWK
ncbi:hypothetical protein MPH_12610 [Macrophomina phaseolina MS6]|uniref:Uncharacterized protein n=1 Tax=Macrophomina phaseolina (strain MS6) TaxID=1126212 RepID=K2RJL8_MACPH|nr:hypothetical protein MPH_12610 [Macrophomina phaseolina MS6]